MLALALCLCTGAVKFEDLRSAEVRSADKAKAAAAAAGAGPAAAAAAGGGGGSRLAAFAEVFWQALEGMTPAQRIDLAFFSCVLYCCTPSPHTHHRTPQHTTAHRHCRRMLAARRLTDLTAWLAG